MSTRIFSFCSFFLILETEALEKRVKREGMGGLCFREFFNF